MNTKNKILVMGGPYTGKSFFIQNVLKHDQEKVFAVGDYIRKNVRQDGGLLNPNDLMDIYKTFDHDGWVIDNPAKTFDQLITFHRTFDLINYQIYYLERTLTVENLKNRESRNDDKFLMKKITEYKKHENLIKTFLLYNNDNYFSVDLIYIPN